MLRRDICASLFIDHVENNLDFVEADTLMVRLVAVEAWVDLVNELIGGFAVLQTAGNAVSIHLEDERLELVSIKEFVPIGIRLSEGSLELLAESDEGLWV